MLTKSRKDAITAVVRLKDRIKMICYLSLKWANVHKRILTMLLTRVRMFVTNFVSNRFSVHIRISAITNSFVVKISIVQGIELDVASNNRVTTCHSVLHSTLY